MTMRLVFFGFIACLAAAVLAGCGEPQSCLVTGTVTADGTPVSIGLVSLERTDAVAPPTSAAVAAGRFAVPGRANLRPGSYVVRVTAPDLDRCDPAAAHDPERPNPHVPLLAAPWNEASTLVVRLVAGTNRLDLTGPRAGPPRVTPGTAGGEAGKR